ncbi:MAG TPA: enoyl-CoA hydratase-related protein [Myxococcales bacterium]|nr:enoyl-CoA hydratase-related protein [Myxococcales bacterium]
MEDAGVQRRLEAGVLLLTINRPQQRNALSAAVVQQLQRWISEADADPAVRALVLTGAGDRVFSAGGDLASIGEGAVAAHDGRRAYGSLLLSLQACRKPSIARVNGHALAGGLGLVLACDLAVAADDVELGTPEIDVGLFPMMLMALLQRHLGRKRALELVLTGERLSAFKALELGLLNRAVPRAELEGATFALAQTLCGKSQATLALGRRAFYTAEDLPLAQALEYLAAQLSLNVTLEDAAEGVTAFLEKRKPQWRDR